MRWVGGIFVHDKSEAHLTNSTLTGNKGEYAGGMYLHYSEANVTDSLLIENNSNRTVAIELFNSTIHVIYCSLTGNKGEQVGGICVYESEAHVTNCTPD